MDQHQYGLAQIARDFGMVREQEGRANFDASISSYVNRLTSYDDVPAERLFQALGMGFADYEPDHVYMVTSPEIMAQLRGANLVDQTTITEGNMEFQTIFGGKFRLVMTRANSSVSTAQGIVSGAVGNKTTFLVKPGSIVMANMDVPMDSYSGGGSTDVFYKWGYTCHPGGHSWLNKPVWTERTAEEILGATPEQAVAEMEHWRMDAVPIFES